MTLLALAAPATAALLALFGPRRWAGWWGVLAAAVSTVAVWSLWPAVTVAPLVQPLPTILPGVAMGFRVDALGLTFAMLAATLWMVTSVYAVGYANATAMAQQPRFFAAFAASIGAAIGVAFAGDLVTFFVFYELLTVTTYPLVVHKESPKAYAAGRRYLLFALGGGLALLVAVVWTRQLTGGAVAFVPGGFLAGAVPRGGAALLFALFVAGVAVKAAVMPLHGWLPSAMVAPTPVSALLHAVAVVKAGVFGVLRVIGFVFGPEALAVFRGADVLAALAMLTILAGSLLALRQENLKRRLAYSTIVHLSYIVLGAALVAPAAYRGAVLHMVNHGLAKITLFFAAGAIYASTKAENIRELAGLGYRMPWTFAAFTLASLALVGFPGLAGFPGKFWLGRGALEAEALVALGVMLGGAVFTAGYLLPIIRVAYFPDEPATRETAEAPPLMVLPLLATALLATVFGMWPAVMDGQLALAASAASAVFGGGP